MSITSIWWRSETKGSSRGQKPPNIDKAQDLNDHGNAADDLHIVG